jgi:hypothetical protein
VRADIKKPATRFTLIAALTMGLLAASVSSALAASGGDGAFNARANINVPPPPFGEACATYSNYNVALTFDDRSTFTASSDPDPSSSNFQWGEVGDGTHHPQTSATGTTACSDAAGQPEAGFTGTLVLPSGQECKLTGGSYTRVGIDLKYTFTDVTPGLPCPSAPLNVTANLKVLQHFDPPLTIGPIEITELTACSSLIAPTTCVIENGSY